MLGLAFTGANTKNSLMTIKFKTNDGGYQASRMHIVLVAQHIIKVGDSGVTIFGSSYIKSSYIVANTVGH